MTAKVADRYGKGWCRKVASAARCPFQAEIELYFDKNKRFKDSSVENGELVSEAEWAAQREGS